jgi:four helix bundle protein
MITTKSEELKAKSQVKNLKRELKYRAFYFSLDVIRFMEMLDLHRPAVKIVADQLIRSVTSIGANIVEAQGSASKREFVNYFHIALKSAQETKYWIAILRELVPENRDKIITLLTEADELTKIISSSILTMKGKRSL